MAHQEQHVETHHEGDAHEIEVTVETELGTLLDLSGGSAEWLLFETRQFAADVDAVLTKDDDDVGGQGGITFTTPEDGELTVKIDTGDTDGLVDWAALEAESEEDEVLETDFHHRLRVTVDGDRATVMTGDFTINR